MSNPTVRKITLTSPEQVYEYMAAKHDKQKPGGPRGVTGEEYRALLADDFKGLTVPKHMLESSNCRCPFGADFENLKEVATAIFDSLNYRQGGTGKVQIEDRSKHGFTPEASTTPSSSDSTETDVKPVERPDPFNGGDFDNPGPDPEQNNQTNTRRYNPTRPQYSYSPPRGGGYSGSGYYGGDAGLAMWAGQSGDGIWFDESFLRAIAPMMGMSVGEIKAARDRGEQLIIYG